MTNYGQDAANVMQALASNPDCWYDQGDQGGGYPIYINGSDGRTLSIDTGKYDCSGSTTASWEAVVDWFGDYRGYTGSMVDVFTGTGQFEAIPDQPPFPNGALPGDLMVHHDAGLQHACMFVGTPDNMAIAEFTNYDVPPRSWYTPWMSGTWLRYTGERDSMDENSITQRVWEYSSPNQIPKGATHGNMQDIIVYLNDFADRNPGHIEENVWNYSLVGDYNSGTSAGTRLICIDKYINDIREYLEDSFAVQDTQTPTGMRDRLAYMAVGLKAVENNTDVMSKSVEEVKNNLNKTYSIVEKLAQAANLIADKTAPADVTQSLQGVDKLTTERDQEPSGNKQGSYSEDGLHPENCENTFRSNGSIAFLKAHSI